MARPAAPTDAQLVEWWGLVVEGVTATSRLIEVDVARFDVPITWFEVLLRLRRSPGNRLGASRLATEVSFSSGGLTKLIDRMVTAGLVERAPCVADRRVVWVSLTASGRQLIDDATRSHAALLRTRVLEVLGTAAFEQLAAVGRTLRDAASPAHRSTAAHQVG
jgi:DNA-binding MarR family transcriptional regulator